MLLIMNLLRPQISNFEISFFIFIQIVIWVGQNSVLESFRNGVFIWVLFVINATLLTSHGTSLHRPSFLGCIACCSLRLPSLALCLLLMFSILFSFESIFFSFQIILCRLTCFHFLLELSHFLPMLDHSLLQSLSFFNSLSLLQF